MTEATLKAAFVKQLRATYPRWTVFLHQDKIRAGVPDISITGEGMTSWWECKFAHSSFDSPKVQELTCVRLAQAGNCRYLIWADLPNFGKRIIIAHPADVARPRSTAVVNAYNLLRCARSRVGVGFNLHWLIYEVACMHAFPCKPGVN
jgi:hypothetical protein